MKQKRTFKTRRHGDSQHLTTLEGRSIPSDYTQWALRAWEPTPVERLRILLLGSPGHGKTSFVSSIPDALILDPEIAAGDVWQPKAARTRPMSLPDYEALVDKLEADGLSGNHAFTTIVFDTVDKFMDLIVPHLTKEYNATHDKPVKFITDLAKGAGWESIRRYMMNWIYRLSQAGYGLILNAHRKDKEQLTHSGSTATVRAPALTPALLASVNREVHMIVGINKVARAHSVKKEFTSARTGKTVTRVVRVETRYDYFLEFSDPLNLDEDDSYDVDGSTAKARYAQFLPEEVPVGLGDGWQTLSAVYNSAVQAAGEAIKGKAVS